MTARRAHGQVTLHIVPVELHEANAAVRRWHRHHKPVLSHRFSLGCVTDDGQLHGVAIAGRPVARMAGSPRDVLEVTRLATDGTPNACSKLLGAVVRAAKAMGFLRVQTYTLDVENGASLRGAGWTYECTTRGGQWKHTDGRPRRDDQPTGQKKRWSASAAQRPHTVMTSETASGMGAQGMVQGVLPL